jgi:hypothetical protein
MLIQCHCCGKSGEKQEFKRFLSNGVKYKCQTAECEEIKREKIRCAKLQNKRPVINDDELDRATELGNYVYENNDTFIKAEKQYRDGCVRKIDPMSKKIYKYCLFSATWSKTNEILTHNDELTISNKFNPIHFSEADTSEADTSEADTSVMQCDEAMR